MGEETSAETYRKHSQVQTTHGQEFIGTWKLAGFEKILDIGCGDGRLTSLIATKFPSTSITGVDISSAMITLARDTYPAITFIETDALAYDSPAPFDVIVCMSTLHWFTDQQAILAKMKSLLNPEGRIFILAYSPVEKYWKPIEEAVFDPKWEAYRVQDALYCEPPKEELIETFRKARFTIASFEEHHHTATFEGKDHFIKHVGGFLPQVINIPKEKHGKLLDSIGNNFVAWNKQGADGHYTLAYETYHITLTLEQEK